MQVADGVFDPLEGFVFDDALDGVGGEGEALGVADGGGEVAAGGAPAGLAFEADTVGDAEVAGDVEETGVAGTDVEESGGWWGGAGEEPAVVPGQGGGQGRAVSRGGCLRIAHNSSSVLRWHERTGRGDACEDGL